MTISNTSKALTQISAQIIERNFLKTAILWEQTLKEEDHIILLVRLKQTKRDLRAI